MLYEHAAIHYDSQTRLPGLGGSIFVNNTKLHPHGLSTNVDGLIDNGGHIIRPAEDVNYVDLLGDGSEVGVRLFAKDGIGLGLTGTMRYPWSCRYLATLWLSLSGLGERPTTAMTLLFSSMSRTVFMRVLSR